MPGTEWQCYDWQTQSSPCLQGRGGPDASGQYELLHRQAQAAAADLLAAMRGEHPDHMRQRRESVADMIVELAEYFAAQHKVEAVSVQEG